MSTSSQRSKSSRENEKPHLGLQSTLRGAVVNIANRLPVERLRPHWVVCLLAFSILAAGFIFIPVGEENELRVMLMFFCFVMIFGVSVLVSAWGQSKAEQRLTDTDSEEASTMTRSPLPIEKRSQLAPSQFNQRSASKVRSTTKKAGKQTEFVFEKGSSSQ